MYKKSDYTYTLPASLIAQTSVQPHHDARLMVVDKETGDIIAHSTFWNLDQYLRDNVVFYFNNTKVLRARIRLKAKEYTKYNGEIDTMEDGEILYLKDQGEKTFEALVRPGKKFKIGTKIPFSDGYIEVIGETNTGRLFQAHDVDIFDIMESEGELPLPPYIEYKKEKEVDYQTAFGEKSGSVAAPTASLHFTPELLAKLPSVKRFVTLHVGLGTFKTVDTEDIRDYEIHDEVVEIEKSLLEQIAQDKKGGKKILAVGTTACRTLESLPHLWKSLDQNEKAKFSLPTQKYWDNTIKTLEKNLVHDVEMRGNSFQFKTKIYIYPGVPFRVVEELITNFHLPESSLLLLVGAFIGHDKLKDLYEKAIEAKYRFFSFGDGMFIKEK